MKDVHELKRLSSPFPKPQSLAWSDSTLWVTSRQTQRVYALDPQRWVVTWETAAPGVPYGVTAISGGELRVVCGETADDNRIIRRCIPGQGFDPTSAQPCPDDCGSQLSYSGGKLHLSQWYPKKVLTLSESGQVERVIEAPHGICGQAWAHGTLYLATTDDEETTDYWLTEVNLTGREPAFRDMARIPFAARGLAHDGTHFWTNHREQNQIVSFTHINVS